MPPSTDNHHLLHVLQQTLLVPLPLLVEILLLGILAAAQLNRHLKVVGEDVVEVLHSTINRVPVSPVGDAVLEGPHGTDRRVQHPLVVGGVGGGQGLEEGVVRSLVYPALLLARPVQGESEFSVQL